MIAALASDAGWTDLQPVFFAATGVRGTWNRFPVELVYHPRTKNSPRRLVMQVSASTDAELIAQRKFNGFFSNKPITWFGPPLVEVHQPVAANFWIRGDQRIAERMFADMKLASLFDQNLLARHDEVRINAKGIRIRRSLDERPVRVRYNFPRFMLRWDAALFEPIGREEIALAEAIATTLA